MSANVQPVSVGLVGLGTIGTGVVRLFQEHGALIQERLGFPLELSAIADIDLERDRGLDLSAYRLMGDWKELVADPKIDLVIELVGGTGIARELVLAALTAGKSVITANKALLAAHGAEIYRRAEAAGTDVAFEASVGGTIPVLRALREGLCADRVDSIHGIVNGTCNYILTEMEKGGEPYEACLKRAQDLGYAEADPSFDVNGTDSAHKLSILLGLGLGADVGPSEISTEGIERVDAVDIEYARQFGLRIKLLAVAKLSDGAVEARVQPTMIPAASVLAGVDGSMNAVEVRGRMSGPTLYYGAGAGSLPTASAVVADAMELARTKRSGASGRVPPLGTTRLQKLPLRPLSDLEAEYYLRFSVIDRPGVLATITGALGESQISIASLLQPEQGESEAVPVVIMTHGAKEASLSAALGQITERAALTLPTQVIRIERDL
jgi:homoserine dehydrogenase